MIGQSLLCLWRILVCDDRDAVCRSVPQKGQGMRSVDSNLRLGNGNEKTLRGQLRRLLAVGLVAGECVARDGVGSKRGWLDEVIAAGAPSW